ncbi:hypothetical protein NQD34_001586, partial [Periophthalmus magnuspinnatus]
KGEYPVDLFSLEQRQHGWVVLHLFGMIYMFVALAIVCDEFFVPALEVITEKLEISDDVAGATFMAAGGSAPELFTSLIGVFIARSNIGIGTIVGSAVFNILFVIGMCAIFSREMLHLTWWPLFRDVSFYILDLMMLIVFFLDNAIRWWESALLVLGYISYVAFMKFNAQIEKAVKTHCSRHKNTVQVWRADETNKTRPALQRGGSTASLHNASMRNTIFQLMIHTLDPLNEGKRNSCDCSNAARRAALRFVRKPKASCPNKPKQTWRCRTSAYFSVYTDCLVHEKCAEVSRVHAAAVPPALMMKRRKRMERQRRRRRSPPLSLDWPQTLSKQVSYLLLLPIVFPLWVTLPDVRNSASKRYFAMTFVGSILWIGIFSYLMVWWAHQVSGETVGISEEIMGLTILAAGTSIPDLITSVIVARKGLGDMAVSSSVGSNIFDITVGLPVPWLLFSLTHDGESVAVRSNGLFCAIVLLFLMLLFVIASIAACRWKMSRKLGFTMFLLYFLFLVLSVLLQNRILTCPVSV